MAAVPNNTGSTPNNAPGALAKPVYMEGVNNSLASVDAYTKTVSGVVNSATNQFKDTSGKILDALRGLHIKEDLQYLKQLVSGLKNFAKNFSVKELINRLATVFPQLKTLVKAYNDIKAIGKSFEKLVNDLYKEYKAVLVEVNGFLAVIDRTDYNNAMSLASAVNSITDGEFKYAVKDVNGQAAMFGALMAQAVRLNVPGVIPSLVKRIQDYVTLHAVVSAVGSEIVKASSIPALKEASENPGFATILMHVYPNFIADYLHNFKIPKGYTEADYGFLSLTILKAFRKLDSQWDMVSRLANDGKAITTYDIYKLINASSDAKKIILYLVRTSNVPFEKYYGLMVAFSTTTVKQRIHIDFPYFIFGSMSYPRAQYISPLQLQSTF